MNPEVPIAWPDDGLIPAVIKDDASGEVLMVGFMNSEALTTTRETGLVHFWSRSRGKLWKKGETSGHLQHVHNIYVNCEQNSLLVDVRQEGAVCHDGYATCYYRRLEPDNSLVTVRERQFDPLLVYGAPGDTATVLRRWWGAYEYLKTHDLEDVSGTSRTLRDPETTVVTRITDELGELSGVLDGTHVHTSQRDDLVLEASQVCYWVAVESIRLGFSWDEVRIDRAMDQDEGETNAIAVGTLATLLRSRASEISGTGFTASIAHDLFWLTAATCRSLGIEPLEPVRADLGELQDRDYLSPYFAR